MLLTKHFEESNEQLQETQRLLDENTDVFSE